MAASILDLAVYPQLVKRGLAEVAADGPASKAWTPVSAYAPRPSRGDLAAAGSRHRHVSAWTAERCCAARTGRRSSWCVRRPHRAADLAATCMGGGAVRGAGSTMPRICLAGRRIAGTISPRRGRPHPGSRLPATGHADRTAGSAHLPSGSPRGPRAVERRAAAAEIRRGGARRRVPRQLPSSMQLPCWPTPASLAVPPRAACWNPSIVASGFTVEDRRGRSCSTSPMAPALSSSTGTSIVWSGRWHGIAVDGHPCGPECEAAWLRRAA